MEAEFEEREEREIRAAEESELNELEESHRIRSLQRRRDRQVNIDSEIVFQLPYNDYEDSLEPMNFEDSEVTPNGEGAGAVPRRREDQEEEIVRRLRELRCACGNRFGDVLRDEYQRENPGRPMGPPDAHSTPLGPPLRPPPQAPLPPPPQAPFPPPPQAPPQQPVIIKLDKGRQRMAEIPTFEGKKPGLTGYISVEVFLRAVRQETEDPEWNDKERVLLARQHMRGMPRTRFDDRKMANMSWDQFEREMRALYSITDAERKAYLYMYVPHRKPGEHLDSYFDRISVALDNYASDGVMLEEERLDHLRRILKVTLPDELKVPLITQHTYGALVRGILTYAEACPQVKLRPQDIEKENEMLSYTQTVSALLSQQEAAKAATILSPSVAAIPQGQGQGY